MTWTYRLENTETLAATTVKKFTVPTGDPGFTVKAIRVSVWGGAFGGSGSNLMTVNLKKGTTVLAAVALAADQGDATAIYTDITGSTTDPTGVGAADTVGGVVSVSPTFKPTDVFELSLAETGTAVKSAGGICIDVVLADDI